jgi:hypothetical protein
MVNALKFLEYGKGLDVADGILAKVIVDTKDRSTIRISMLLQYATVTYVLKSYSSITDKGLVITQNIRFRQ